jgi:hypothetical protein
MTDRIADSDFVFERPMGATEIEMRTDAEGGGNTNAPNPTEK